jgi:hypothetical protein
MTRPDPLTPLLKIQYPLLFELANNTEITVEQVIGYNIFYLFLRRTISSSLRTQLTELYTKLSVITLSSDKDKILWRWNVDYNFSTHLLYIWLEFVGISNYQYQQT